MALMSSSQKRKEIYKYEAPWPLYSMNWSVRPDKRFRLALGSFVEEYNNKVQIVSLDEETAEFSAKSTFDHPYPTTKIMWIPDSKGRQISNIFRCKVQGTRVDSSFKSIITF